MGRCGGTRCCGGDWTGERADRPDARGVLCAARVGKRRAVAGDRRCLAGRRGAATGRRGGGAGARRGAHRPRRRRTADGAPVPDLAGGLGRRRERGR
ncbi:hypothetical protein E1166_01530 [Micromonospora sp. KC213]|nr:hypothetical protein E1166_01530 [Micromonospora sp. KC213]